MGVDKREPGDRDAAVRDGGDGYSCGSPACIAGWAVYLADGPKSLVTRLRTGTAGTHAKELLGLPDETAAEDLFAPQERDASMEAGPG